MTLLHVIYYINNFHEKTLSLFIMSAVGFEKLLKVFFNMS